MNINIPEVNISSKIATEINNKIEDTFIPKATKLMTENVYVYTIYNIDYAAFVNNDILSLVIKATLKEGNNPQRVMFMTYNYNLGTGNKVSLNEIMELKGLTEATVQNKINKEIKEISKKTEDLKTIGYQVFSRNPDDSMYQIQNTTLYFIGPESYGYILYAYGNSNNTSEVDVILF